MPALPVERSLQEQAAPFAKLLPAEPFTLSDDQAISFLQQPFHPGLFSAPGTNGLCLAVALEFDALSASNTFIGRRSVERLDLDDVLIAASG